MRCLLLFVLFGTLPVFAEITYSQSARFSLDMENVTVQEVLSAIEQKSLYYFTYNMEQIDVHRKVSVNVNDKSITDVLGQLFSGENIKYDIDDKHIVLYKGSSRNIALIKAQQMRKITGTVKDDRGEPIIGANIVEQGTSNGTISDIEGRFSLEISGNSSLIISYIGYIQQKATPGKNNIVNIILSEDTKKLDEVVVIGYGTQKKSDVSGSVTTVSGEKLANLPTAGAAEALQGMAPGLSVNFGTGAPGSDPTITVRGMTSWGSSNEPLVVIDGVPGDMSYLNPEDIKSMTVLKDAATAAIYGARAAAGVILIETNRGGKQELKFGFCLFRYGRPA